MKKWLWVMVCGAGVAAAAPEYPRIDAAKKEYDSHVAQLRANFERMAAAPDDRAWIRAKLQHMVDLDQYHRTFGERIGLHALNPGEQRAFNEFHARNNQDIDVRNLADLKKMLEARPWFTVSEFGPEADRNAWLLVQHADQDIEFQKRILAILEPLASKGETDPKNFAYLFDRVATSFQNPAQRKPQRYGTQGQCTGPGTWEPFPVEQPDKLDERRRSVGLMPEAEYQQFFKNVCHESTEETIRKALEAAKAGG